MADGGVFGLGAECGEIYTNEGVFVLRWGEGRFEDPRGIAVGMSDNAISIYISDFGPAMGGGEGGGVTQFRWTPTATAIVPWGWSAVKNAYRK